MAASGVAADGARLGRGGVEPLGHVLGVLALDRLVDRCQRVGRRAALGGDPGDRGRDLLERHLQRFLTGDGEVCEV